MIYENLEGKFLKSTARFEFNYTQYGFIGVLVLLVMSFGVTILHFKESNWELSFRLIIILIVSIVLILFMMLFGYPYYFFRKHIHKSDEMLTKKFSYYNLRQLLFQSSINKLVEFLYKEQMVQKPKIEMLIRHYESVKTIKTKFAFPFLVALSLTFSAITTCYSLPEEKAEEVLLSMFIITLLFLFLYGTLKLFYF